MANLSLEQRMLHDFHRDASVFAGLFRDVDRHLVIGLREQPMILVATPPFLRYDCVMQMSVPEYGGLVCRATQISACGGELTTGNTGYNNNIASEPPKTRPEPPVSAPNR